MKNVLRIKDAIEPAHQRALGRPMLEFVDSRLHPTTGETVLFSRWLLPDPPSSRRKKPVANVSSQKRRALVIVRLPISGNL